jgi:hypothetical protein
MGNSTEFDYLEYIDTIRRKREVLFLKDTENILIADNNARQKSIMQGFLDPIQSNLPINSEKLHYFTESSLRPISEHNTQSPEYFSNVENFLLSPADTAGLITFLDNKAKLTEDKQLIAKNKDSIVEDETINTVEPPEMVIMTKRHIDQKPQILESQTEIEIQIPTKVDKEIIGYEDKNLLQDQLERRQEEQRIEPEELQEEQQEEQRIERERIAREREEEQRIERERIAREREEEQRIERERIAREREEEQRIEREIIDLDR